MNKVLILLCLLISCGKVQPKGDGCKNNNAAPNISSIDSLLTPLKADSSDCYRNAVSKYSKILGIQVSSYYDAIDWFTIDIDKDGKLDSLVILSPINLLPGDTICQSQERTDRILLMKTAENLYIYDNVISNEKGLATAGGELFGEHSKDEFILKGHLGQSCYFDYNIHVKMHDCALKIRKIHIDNGCQGKSLEKEFDYSKQSFLLSAYKRSLIDSLMKLYAL